MPNVFYRQMCAHFSQRYRFCPQLIDWGANTTTSISLVLATKLPTALSNYLRRDTLNQYRSPLVLAICIVAVTLLCGCSVPNTQSMTPRQLLQFNISTVDAIKVVLCEDETCQNEANQLSATLCDSSMLLCNAAILSDGYRFGCTAHVCMVRGPFDDDSYYKLRITHRDQILTSDVQQIGRSKIATVEFGQLILTEGIVDLDNRSRSWDFWGMEQDNAAYRWLIIPVINLLALIALLGIVSQFSNFSIRPRLRFWFTILITQLLLHLIYLPFFHALKPIMGGIERINLLMLLPLVLTYLLMIVWFYGSTMSTWKAKVPLTILAIILSVGYFILWILINISHTYGSPFATFSWWGLPAANAIRLLFLIAVLLDASIYHKLERPLFTPWTAFGLSLVTNSVGFSILAGMHWYGI